MRKFLNTSYENRVKVDPSTAKGAMPQPLRCAPTAFWIPAKLASINMRTGTLPRLQRVRCVYT